MTAQSKGTDMSNPLRLVPALLVVVSSAAAVAEPIDLQLICRPEYAVLDQRQVRPPDTQGHSPSSTYYLFDNADLFEYRVTLVNVGPTPRTTGADDAPWLSALRLSVHRDGVELGPRELALVPVRRLLRETEYLRDGVPIADLRFHRRSGRLGSDPSEPFDDYRYVDREVDSLPRQIDTYTEVSIVYLLTMPDGGGLPQGLYTLQAVDPATGTRCAREQLVVLRRPLSPLDIVDAHIVRSRYHRAQGDLNAVAQELDLATELAPGSLKAWFYRGALAFELGDLEGQVEAAAKLRQILDKRHGRRDPESLGLVRDAEAFAAQESQLRRRLTLRGDGATR